MLSKRSKQQKLRTTGAKKIIMILHYFINETCISYDFLDFADVERLLKDEEYKPSYYYDKEKKYKIHEAVNSKKVLVVYNDESLLVYDSMKEFDMVFNDVTNNKVIQEEIMKNKNPYEEKFPEISRQLTENFLLTFGLSLNIDTNELLIQLDNNIEKTISDKKPFFFENFLNIIALIGELLKAKYSESTWEMILSDIDNETWSPYLLYKGYRLHIFTYLMEDIDDGITFVHFLSDFYFSMESLLKRRY